jgi:hypothetical protein
MPESLASYRDRPGRPLRDSGMIMQILGDINADRRTERQVWVFRLVDRFDHCCECVALLGGDLTEPKMNSSSSRIDVVRPLIMIFRGLILPFFNEPTAVRMGYLYSNKKHERRGLLLSRAARIFASRWQRCSPARQRSPIKLLARCCHHQPLAHDQRCRFCSLASSRRPSPVCWPTSGRRPPCARFERFPSSWILAAGRQIMIASFGCLPRGLRSLRALTSISINHSAARSDNTLPSPTTLPIIVSPTALNRPKA